MQLPALKQLSLDNTNISDAGEETLRSFAGLQSLDLYQTHISKKGYEALRAGLRNCKIFFDEQSGLPPGRIGKN